MTLFCKFKRKKTGKKMKYPKKKKKYIKKDKMIIKKDNFFSNHNFKHICKTECKNNRDSS